MLIGNYEPILCVFAESI